MSPAPSTPTGAPTAPAPEVEAALTVATRWAEAIKAQAIYPAGHHRVAAAFAALLESLGPAHAALPPPDRAPGALRIVFADGGMLLGSARLDVDPEGPLAWLRQRMDHAGLAGADLLPEVTPEAFEGFGRRLLEIFATKDPQRDPLALWDKVNCPGLNPLDRRFEGVFGGRSAKGAAIQATWGELGPLLAPSEQARCTDALRDDPAIRERLASIGRRLSSAGKVEGEQVGVDLLRRVTGVLPASAATDGLRLRAVAGGLLDALEQRVEAANPTGALQAFFDDPALERRVAYLCTAMFRRDHTVADPEAAATRDRLRAQGHSGDDRIDGDVASFLRELQALPAFTPTPELAATLESPAEELGAMLHLLHTRPDAPSLPGLSARIDALLAVAGPAERKVLANVLERGTQRADEPGAGSANVRVLDVLRALGRSALLRQVGWLTRERVIETFPREVLTWLEALDLANPGDRAELGGMLRTLGRERLAAATAQLLGPGGVLEPENLARLLAVPDAALSPLVRLACVRGGEALRGPIVDWLRRLAMPWTDACLLHVLDDPRALPEAYLGACFDHLEQVPLSPAIPALVATHLMRYVESTAGREDRRARRIQALRHLSAYRLPQVDELLRRLAFGRRWLVLRQEPRPVRLAALEALNHRGAA